MTQSQCILHRLRTKSSIRTFHFRCQLQALESPACLLFSPTCCKIWVPTYALRFDNSLEKLPELRKALYFWLRFYGKWYKVGIAKWREHKIWEDPKYSDSMSSGCITFPVHWCVLPSRILTWALASRVFIGVLLCRYDWLNHCSCDYIQSLVLPFLSGGWAEITSLSASGLKSYG